MIMEGIKQTGENRFQLCGVQNCCPEVQIDEKNEKITITDDDNGRVSINFEQARSFGKLVAEKLPK